MPTPGLPTSWRPYRQALDYCLESGEGRRQDLQSIRIKYTQGKIVLAWNFHRDRAIVREPLANHRGYFQGSVPVLLVVHRVRRANGTVFARNRAASPPITSSLGFWKIARFKAIQTIRILSTTQHHRTYSYWSTLTLEVVPEHRKFLQRRCTEPPKILLHRHKTLLVMNPLHSDIRIRSTPTTGVPYPHYRYYRN